jgi:TolB-like protein
MSGRIWLLLLCLGLASACSFKDKPTVLKQGPLPEAGEICRIAVLPFVNQTAYKQGDDIFARVFISELVNKGGYRVAQEGDVRKFYQQMALLPTQGPSVEQLRALADLLDVQVIVAGTVVEMQDKSRYGQRLDPSVAVIVRIIEGSSGRTLWASYIRREGSQYRRIMHFGLVNSLTSLARHASAEIVAEWQKQGFKKCTEQ